MVSLPSATLLNVTLDRRRVARQQLDLVGVNGQRVVGGAIGQSADRRDHSVR